MMICGVDVVGTVACGDGALGHGRYIKNEPSRDPNKKRSISKDEKRKISIAWLGISPQWTSILNATAL